MPGETWLQFGTIGFSELLLIFIIVLLLFGGKKLPEIARFLGEAVREFRRAASEVERPIREARAGLTYAIPKNEEAILRETAMKLGIGTEGKTIQEISEEVVKKIREAAQRSGAG